MAELAVDTKVLVIGDSRNSFYSDLEILIKKNTEVTVLNESRVAKKVLVPISKDVSIIFSVPHKSISNKKNYEQIKIK